MRVYATTRVLSPETLRDGLIRRGAQVCHVNPVSYADEQRLVEAIRTRHRGTVITHRSAVTLIDPGVETERRTYQLYLHKISVLIMLCRRFEVVKGTWLSRRGSFSGPVFIVREKGWPPSRLIGD